VIDSSGARPAGGGTQGLSRRDFLGVTASCGAHLLYVGSAVPNWARDFSAPGRHRAIVAQEPWGRLESVGEGLWALISTPLTGDRTTLCNGGIVAGTHGCLVVESFATPNGAAWMAQQARELTGRWPSHVVLTHFHGDHANGVEGYGADERPDVFATEKTRNLISEADAGRAVPTDSLRAHMLADVVKIDPSSAASIDLGDRAVHLVPRLGHTPSDVTVEIAEPSVVWCGDLVWNRMFPNYRDAIPSQLSRGVRALVRDQATVYVPGHGSVADASDLNRYIELIDDVEAAARLAHERGIPATEAAESYSVPESLGEWVMFSPRYYEVALSAWEKELGRT